MFYDSENYELTSSTEVDNFLAELPFDLLKESIIDQINDPMSTHVNYLETIMEKCKLCKENVSESEESLSKIDEALIEFFTFIMVKINDRFDLGIDIEGLADSKDIIEIGESVYNYFIIRYEKNIAKYMSAYIIKNKKELATYYSDKNRKDITTISHKKQIKDSQDLNIVANLSSIVNYIISLDIDPIEFVSLSTGQNNYDASVIKGLIIANRLVGNFVKDYIALSVDEHDYLIDEIQTDIRVRIIKKLT